MNDLSEILTKTIETAKTAGQFIRNESKTFDRSKTESKGLNDLVSYVDKEAEKIIVSRLKEILPDADFIAEEGTEVQSGKDYTWIIDPLDGTTNFIHGIPIFAVSIGLKHHDELVLGVVYEVNFDECFYARKGNGAFMNGKPIHVSKPATLSDSLVVTGFPYSAFEKIDDYLKILRKLMETCHGLRRLGSAATDLCYVACGRAEGFFEYDLKPYDVAAGVVILSEAGGSVTDFSGGNDFLFGREILASNSHIHPEFLTEIQKIW